MMEELTEASALNMEVERANGPLALMPFEEPSSSNTKVTFLLSFSKPLRCSLLNLTAFAGGKETANG